MTIDSVPTHFENPAIQHICVENVPEWKDVPAHDVDILQLCVGHTNKLFKASLNKNHTSNSRSIVLVRVFGESNGCFYAPEFEASIFRVLGKVDKHFAPGLLAEFNGGRIEEWIEGKSLPIEFGRCAVVLHEIAETIMRFHAISSDASFPKEFLDRPVCQISRIEAWMAQGVTVDIPTDSHNGRLVARYNLEYRKQCVEHVKNVLCLKDAKNPVLVDLKGEVYEPCPYMMRVLFAHNDCHENNIMRPVDYSLPDHSKTRRAVAGVKDLSPLVQHAHEHHTASSAYVTANTPSCVKCLQVRMEESDGKAYVPPSADIVDGQEASEMPVPPCWLDNARQTCTCVPPKSQGLKTTKPSLRLIDFEFSDVNFAGYDLANYMCETMMDYLRTSDRTVGFACSPEGYPSISLRREFVRAYLQSYFSTIGRSEQPSEYEIERAVKTVDRLTLTSHLVWIWWSVIRAAQCPVVDGFDFAHYGLMRCHQYDAVVERLHLPRAGEEHLVEEHLQRLSQENQTDIKCKTGCTQM